MHTEIESFESPKLTLLDFSLWGWMNNEVYTRKVDTRNKSLGRILDTGARMKKGEDQPRQKTRDLRTRGAECIEVYSGIFEDLLKTLVNLQLDAQNSYLFTYNTFIKILYMFRTLPCSSSGGLRRNCIYAASGIVTIPEAASTKLRRRSPEDEQGNARNM
jgi:hypothetical protein